MATLLVGFAEFERELIHARCSEGFSRARGVIIDRQPKPTHFQRRDALRGKAGAEPVHEIACLFDVDANTICRLRPEVRV